MKSGIWELEISNIEGFDLLVPLSYLSATELEIDFHTGGCGPGGLGDYFVPDTLYGETIFIACQIHDWMYHEGVTEEDKKIADRVFLWNMTVLIQDRPHEDEKEKQLLDTLRLRRVMTYYQAVSYGGSEAFNSGKTPKKEDIDSDLL